MENIFVLFLLVVVSMIDRASISIAMPTIAKDLGLSDTMQGLILSGFFWTYACMQIPGGFLADKFGARIILACSAILWGTAEALLGYAQQALPYLLLIYCLVQVKHLYFLLEPD